MPKKTMFVTDHETRTFYVEASGDLMVRDYDYEGGRTLVDKSELADFAAWLASETVNTKDTKR